MQNQYYLFLVLDGEEGNNFLENKFMICCDSLINLDEFTSAYQNAQDLGDDINHTNNPVKFVNAIILSECEYQKLVKSNRKQKLVKTLPVLFQEDRDFFEQQTKDENIKYYYDLDIINRYKNYLLNNRYMISDSLVSSVKLGIDIDASITVPDMERVFLAYYNKKTYRIMRDTYFELKKFRMIKLKNDNQKTRN